MMNTRSLSLTVLALGATMACGVSKESRVADSARAAAAAEQTRLATQLAAQKDSLTRVVLQADEFIMRIDSSVSRVKDLTKHKRKGAKLDPLAEQVQNRRAVMERVNALVARAQATQAALAKSNKDNKALRAQLASDSVMIADLNATIQRQTATIDALSTRIDSLSGVTKQMGATITELEQQHNKAFYVIGTEDDLVQRNVIVREGGANLLIAHPGRTLQISRSVDPAVFTAIDQRGTQTIAVPDPNRRYRVVSRQSLDYATVTDRDNNTFQGNLKIADAPKFWAPSRFLVLVEQ